MTGRHRPYRRSPGIRGDRAPRAELGDGASPTVLERLRAFGATRSSDEWAEMMVTATLVVVSAVVIFLLGASAFLGGTDADDRPLKAYAAKGDAVAPYDGRVDEPAASSSGGGGMSAGSLQSVPLGASQACDTARADFDEAIVSSGRRLFHFWEPADPCATNHRGQR